MGFSFFHTSIAALNCFSSGYFFFSALPTWKMSFVSRAPSGVMKPEKKLTITTPPFFFNSRSTSSGTLRGWLARA